MTPLLAAQFTVKVRVAAGTLFSNVVERNNDSRRSHDTEWTRIRHGIEEHRLFFKPLTPSAPAFASAL
jgi:hypothetical protein